jgi:AAA+ ATPase superfamily predicted ATPase
MEFLDRTKEIEQLSEAWAGIGDRRSFIALYGRRRCGKSTLLRRMIREQDVYFMASESSTAMQLQQLAHALAKNFPAFDAVTYANYDQLFEVLESRISEPFTLVIDEFPYLIQQDAGLASILQRVLDDPAKRKFNLVLCGSSQQMMHDAILSGTAPLYGRADEILHIKPLDAGWLSEVLPSASADAVIMEYAVWGGVPRYWETRERHKSLRETVLRTLLQTTGLFYDEPRRLLLDDLRDLTQPISLLSVIANGVHRPSEIGARLSRKASELQRPLQRLVALGYIRREVPLFASIRASKLVHYTISDPFLRFYYRFILTNASMIGAGASEGVWQLIEAGLSQHTSQVWEQLCMQAVRKGMLGKDLVYVGRWWGKSSNGKPMEIDILATNSAKDRWIVVECKWSLSAKPDTIRTDTANKVRMLPFYKGEPVESFVAARGLKGNIEEGVINPEDVLGWLRD